VFLFWWVIHNKVKVKVKVKVKKRGTVELKTV
jgi:hypothetical protein